jgi:uncharacterized protein YdeI (YjbR/CyaY-like superfamily)
MEIGETLYVTDRARWRQWLTKHHDTKKEIWLVYPHKVSGKPRISYNDAVEEALCFGWIDSTVKRHGAASAQRFTPRRKNSTYSQMNKERLRWLLAHEQLAPFMVPVAKEVLREQFVYPKDIIAAIRKNKRAWEHYQGFSESYRRIRVGYIENNRSNAELFRKALANFISKTASGKQIGYGGIEKYY